MKNAISMWRKAIIHPLPLLLFLAVAAVPLASGQRRGGDPDRARPMDCFTANETCFNQRSSACRNSIMVLYGVCGRSWKYCDSGNVAFCRSHLEVVRKRTVFSGCVCYDVGTPYDQCDNLWRILNQNPCAKTPVPRRPKGEPMDADVVVDRNGFTTNQGRRDRWPKPKPKKKKKKKTKFKTIRQQLEQVGVKPDDGEGPSCLTVMRQCDNSLKCKALRADFLDHCRFTVCERNNEMCLSTYEHIRLFSVFKCTCLSVPADDVETAQACRQFRSQFVENKCLALMNSQTLYGFHVSKKNGASEEDAKKAPVASRELPHAGSGTNRASPAARPKPARGQTAVARMPPENCYNVYKDCVRSPTCLVRVINISESCQESGEKSGCQDRKRCMQALNEFYNIRKFGIRALICDCVDGNDRHCAAKRDLLRPPCSYESRATSCLSLIDKCYKDTDCKPRYQLFEEYCMIDPLVNKCKGTPEKCLDAYRTLYGTNLTQRCSCHLSGVPPSFRADAKKTERYLQTCKQLQDEFRQPTCLHGRFEIGSWKAVRRGSPGKPRKPIDQRRQAACQSSLAPHIPEATIRLYHNDSCSELCQCTQLGQVRCRVLPCSNALPCRAPPPGSRCQCVFGELLCPPSPLLLASRSPPGFYLHVGFSPAEQRLLQEHSPGADLGNLSRALTWLLNATTAGGSRLCQLRLQSRTSTSALYRVRLVDVAPGGARGPGPGPPSVASACQYPIRLLKLMIDARDPGVRSHPQLSLMRQAHVFESALATPTGDDGYGVVGPDGRGRLGSPRAPRGRPAVTAGGHRGGTNATAPAGSLVALLALWSLVWRGLRDPA